MEGRLIFVYSLRGYNKPIMEDRQENEAAGHIVSIAKQREDRNGLGYETSRPAPSDLFPPCIHYLKA